MKKMVGSYKAWSILQESQVKDLIQIDLEHSNISLDNERMGIYNSQRGNKKTDKLIKIFNLPIIRKHNLDQDTNFTKESSKHFEK